MASSTSKRVSVVILLIAAVSAAAQDFSEIKIEKVANGLHHAEGPAWSPEGFLLYSDTVSNKLHKFIAGQKDAEFADIPGGPSGNAYDAQGRLYTCEVRERRVTRIAKNGKTEIVAARFEGKRFNAPNDIVVRHDGHVYFTDPAFGNQQDTAELGFNGVFHVTPKGELENIAKLKTRPNGVALSLNGRTLYVSDSDARTIRAYELDRNGSLDRANEGRVVVDKIPGIPGGIRIDEKGNLWVAASGVFNYSPQGKLLGKVLLSETPTNLSFGDPDLSSLYITARTSVYRVRLGIKGAP